MESLANFFVSRNYETQVVPLSSCGAVAPQAIDVLPAASTADDLTGQILWPVARATAAFVAAEGARGALPRGGAALELGAGCGIVALVASRFVSSVWLTDGEDEILPLMERNLAHAAPGCAAHAAVLRWGDAGDAAALAAAAGRARWPVLLGADVVYWPQGIDPLCATVAALLAADGVFYLGYNDRLPGNRQALEHGLHARGLCAVIVPLESVDVADLHDAAREKITLFKITWSAAARAAWLEAGEAHEAAI